MSAQTDQNPESQNATKEGTSNEDAFEGVTAIITGASRGIGRALALDLGTRGVKVVCAARATNERRFKIPGTIDETVEQIQAAGGQALAVSTDLSIPSEIEALIDTTVAHFGGIDILVNNAAVTFAGDAEISPKHYELIMNINVRAPLLASLYARPHLAKSNRGRILNVSSVTSLIYVPSMMTYGMSKAALDHLSVSTAMQFLEDGIAVNCFRIDTRVATEGYMMNVSAGDAQGNTEDNTQEEDFSDWITPEQTAKAMCWMLEQPSDYTANIEDMVEMAVRTGTIPGLDSTQRIETPWRINK